MSTKLDRILILGIPILIVFTSSDIEANFEALGASHIDSSFKEMLRELNSGEEAAEEATEDAPIINFRPSQYWINGALAALDDADEQVVEYALKRFIEHDVVKRIPRKKITQIVELLDKESVDSRLVISVLGKIGREAKDSLPQLVKLLNDSDENTQKAILHAMAEMGEPAAAQTPALVDFLVEKSDWEKTAWSGSILSPSYEPTIRDLILDLILEMGKTAADQAIKILSQMERKPKSSEETRKKAFISSIYIKIKMGEAAEEQLTRLINFMLETSDWDGDISSTPRGVSGASKFLGSMRREIDFCLFPKMGKSLTEQAVKILEQKENNPSSSVKTRNKTRFYIWAFEAFEQNFRFSQKPPAEGIPEEAAEEDIIEEAPAEDIIEEAPAEDIIEDAPLEEKKEIKICDFEFETGPQITDECRDVLKKNICEPIDIIKKKNSEVTTIAIIQESSKNKIMDPRCLLELAKHLTELDSELQISVVIALAQIGELAADQTEQLGALLHRQKTDDIFSDDAERIGAIIYALASIGESASSQSSQIVKYLDVSDVTLRRIAANALVRMSSTINDRTTILLKTIVNSDWYIRDESLKVLETMTPLPLDYIVPILELVHRDSGQKNRYRFLAHVVGGGKENAETVLKWLGGHPAKLVLPRVDDIAEARELLGLFMDFLPLTLKFPNIRKELSRTITDLVHSEINSFTSGDLVLLRKLKHKIDSFSPVHAEQISTVINHIEKNERPINVINKLLIIVLGHFLFWILLIFVYPNSRWVQSVFFWNKRIRRIFGLFYVDILITTVSFIRRRLFLPFSDILLSSADLKSFSSDTYFKESAVETDDSKTLKPLVDVLKKLDGQVVLQGESGLGKTMFLRYLISNSNRLAIFLFASECREGVINTIRDKLEGPVQDSGFLERLIYRGTLDIYIDGLNEVSSDIRTQITLFAEKCANIILTTQPIEWKPPSGARILNLQPLSKSQIERFLCSRWKTVGEIEPLSKEKYKRDCTKYLNREIGSQKSAEEIRVAKSIMSNPMELTIIAYMIASGVQPDLMQLLHQYYVNMADDYKRMYLNDFPQKSFSEHVYRMRLENLPLIQDENFANELKIMEKHRMVIRRDETKMTNWYFRHDKIMDFFIAQLFIGRDNPRIMEHMSDARFRGVYFLLLHLMTPEDAGLLREQLIVYAAETGDHTISDAFVLHIRQLSEKSRTEGKK